MPNVVTYSTFNCGVGNRMSVIDTGGTTSYTTNALNQYTSVGGAAYVYDDNGNMTYDGTNMYDYDPENRLAKVTSVDGPVAAACDIDLAFTTGGDAEWFLQTSETYDGEDAAQSGQIDDDEETWLQTTVEGMGIIKFWWKVSCDGNDAMVFYIDGSRKAGRAGIDSTWHYISKTIDTTGTHTLRWLYRKNSSGAAGSDCAWVDCVQWTGMMPDANGWDEIEYVYDLSGRRIEKKVDGTTELKFLYDGDHIIAEYDANDTLLRKYVHGPCIDQPICLIESSGTYAGTQYYHYDALGSVVAMTDSSGDIVQLYEYSVYGQVAASDANHPNRFMFTGREFDKDTGLYYYRARYYHPEIGRFLQTDPIGYGDAVNLYPYCGNNAPNQTDSSGCMSEEAANGYRVVTDPTTTTLYGYNHFGAWLTYIGAPMATSFGAHYILGMSWDEIEEWRVSKTAREINITVDYAEFYGVTVLRLNGLNILTNGTLNRILKAGDVGHYSFHEANQMEEWGWTEWIPRGPSLYDFWCPFRHNKTGSWVYYEGELGYSVAGPFPWYAGTTYVGGKYDDSDISYIMQGHAARAAGLPAQLLVWAIQYHNLSEHWHEAPPGKIFWAMKGYNEYTMRDDW